MGVCLESIDDGLTILIEILVLPQDKHTLMTRAVVFGDGVMVGWLVEE